MKEQIVSRHLLWDTTITSWTSWEDWCKDWNRTQNKDILIGMLHKGFDVYCRNNQIRFDDELLNEANSRLILYLSLADGWSENIHQSFFAQYQSTIPYSEPCLCNQHCPLRTEISKKAFEMLCSNPFKEWVEADSYGERREDLAVRYTSQFFLPVLMGFFSEMGDKGVRYRNLPFKPEATQNQRYAEKFLFKLIQTIWGWRENTFADELRPAEELEKKRVYCEQKRARLNEAKLWSLEILVRLERLDVLKDFELEKADEEKLEEIALRSWIGSPHVKDSRQVRTFQEALKANNRTAWWLHKYRTTRIPEPPKKSRRKRRKVRR